MMGSQLQNLIAAHWDDFWLNILAGIPFLAFDLLIITMLLPVTLRWWDERNWRETRAIAIRRMTVVYADLRMGLYHDTLIDKLGSADGFGLLPSDETDKLANQCAMDLLAGLHDYSIRIDQELQSALHVLDAERTKQILSLHYSIKALIADLENLCRDYIARYTCGDLAHFRGSRSGDHSEPSSEIWHDHGLDKPIFEVASRLQELRIRYANDAFELLQLRGAIPAALYQPVCLYRALYAYEERSLGYRNCRSRGCAEAARYCRAITEKISRLPPVSSPFATLSQRLLGRGYTQLVDAPPW